MLHELLAGLPESWLTARDTPDGWTARDVVGHLISAELDDWIPRAEIIVNEGTSRAFEPFDRHAHIERDRDASLHQLLDRFAELRAANVGRIRDLVIDDGDLETPGLHPEIGEVTLGELIATWTVHDLDHVVPDLRGPGRCARRGRWTMEAVPGHPVAQGWRHNA